jgi:putative DNA primase/helicase
LANFSQILPSEQKCFITLVSKTKRPIAPDWLKNGKTFANAKADSTNVGLILGEQSGILDIDLDCREAKALSDIMLPEAIAVFDRGSADSGHYLFRASSFGPRKTFNSEGVKSTLVELRGDGSQTMIPPSVHPNGEALVFTSSNLKAPEVRYEDLLKSVNLLAACSEIAQNWREGHRHDLALAFAGLCLKQDVEHNLVTQIVQRICDINGDLDVDDRLNAIRTSYAQSADSLLGYNGLVDCLGQSKAKRIADRIAAYSSQEFSSDIAVMEPMEGDLVNFGQFSDRSNVTEAKVGTVFSRWLDGKAVYVVEKKQWMIWNGNYWEADQRSTITKLAYQFVTEAKEALFDRGKYSGLSNLSQFESLNKLDNIARFASTDCSVSATEFDTDLFLLASRSSWIDLGSGNSMAPNPEKLVSKALAIEHDQQASCPAFL